jgi:hypothetical protein
VELSSRPDEPAPIATPTPEPMQMQLSEEQKQLKAEKEMRVKLFGHEENADEWAKKEMEMQLSRRMMW